MIYFLQAGEHVKIGRTKDGDTLKRRITTLQTGQAHKLTVLRTIEAPPWAEMWLHGFFSGVRAAGEWFEYQAEMLTIDVPAAKPVRPRREKCQNNRKSEQFVIRIPHEVARRIKASARADGVSSAKVIINALRIEWGIPEAVKKKETGQ